MYSGQERTTTQKGAAKLILSACRSRLRMRLRPAIRPRTIVRLKARPTIVPHTKAPTAAELHRQAPAIRAAWPAKSVLSLAFLR